MKPISMLRRRAPSQVGIVVAAGAVLLAIGLWAASDSGSSPPTGSIRTRPNVLLILSDQHRWQALPFTETPKLVTPHMERLADEGFRLDNLISQYPLCSPARAMLMTGRWPHQTGVVDNVARGRDPLSTDELTLADAFRAAGYETLYVGKWHLAGRIQSLADYGFDRSIVWSGTNDHWNSRYYDASGVRRESRLYNATHMTDQALELLSEERERPFFMVLAWNPPHSNYTDPPVRFANLYWESEKLPLRENVEVPETHARDDFAVQYRGYHAHVSAIDHELGRLLAALAEAGTLDETLIVYTSDHGDALGSHGHLGKRTPHAESIRVPFLLRWPGRVPAGQRSAAPVGTIDLMPTLLGLVGIQIPTSVEGRDYSGLLTGRGGPRPESQLIMNIANEHEPASNIFPTHLYRGVVTEHFTYAVREEGPWLLFDNRTDRLQIHNRIGDPALEETRERLHEAMLGWLKRSGDDFRVRPGIGADRRAGPGVGAHSVADSPALAITR